MPTVISGNSHIMSNSAINSSKLTFEAKPSQLFMSNWLFCKQYKLVFLFL